ncbi:MAG TPA: histidine kinase [Gemmatimonadaceae bacterium]|nr:histidine kinase [Gemmatimonadaceae bacterium]
MPRAWVWLQLIIGWVPMWALFTMLIVTVHPDAQLSWAVSIAFRMIVAAAALGLIVRRFALRFRWPQPFRLTFIAVQALAATAYAAAWLVLNSLVESMLHGRLVISVGAGIVPFLVIGVWLYVMLAGVTYATHATERAARAEASAARSQLSALRSQLNPHFLFNALHTVVQLIPREPRRASQAAEQLGGLLRETISEDRDLVSFTEERSFVERYLSVEQLRFGGRLEVRFDIDADAGQALIPSFALLTLVENAVRHGAEPNMEPTAVTVSARVADHALTVIVRDTGVGARAPSGGGSHGTGLERLRERLEALYGGRAALELSAGIGRGFTASLTIPQNPE